MTAARLTTATVAAAAAACLILTGCSNSDDAASAGAKKIAVKVTDQGCAAEPATAEAGALTFEVTNTDAKRVTEAEVLKDGKILGEKENLTPGLSGTFTLRLEPGEYVVLCPNAATDQSPFTVTAAKGATAAASVDADLASSVATYKAYLEDQTAQLTAQTEKFVAAVKAGDVAKAKALFAPTRAYYERIEPVAESFGDLDPQIDARVNDVDPGDEWTGFHKLEKALWADGSLDGTGPVADKLLTDVKDLESKVTTVELAPEQIANGAVGLLDEVAKSKITGEEDRYSHTDLWDFAANVAGAREAVDVLAPTLRAKDAALLTTINGQFKDVLASLSQYQTADGYEDYSAVTDDQRRTMTTQVNALAESLSKVAPLIA
ncbi:iron uptake system protein EfeO [Angustibacter luteus]|uniref:Iron uptake system protein EfeO n=1 Tax=Angustibacter luteus TaxID=658456 RepID=A0ABW1JGZ7_9ACTN